jgi:hypothetical protein
MPVILATQEAEIRRIAVWSQHGQIVCKTLSQEKPITKKNWWSGLRCRPWVQAPVPQKKKKKWGLWDRDKGQGETQGHQLVARFWGREWSWVQCSTFFFKCIWIFLFICFCFPWVLSKGPGTSVWREKLFYLFFLSWLNWEDEDSD